MDMSKAVTGVVGLVVCILMVAFLAIPVVEDAALDREYLSNATEGINLYDDGEFTLSHAFGAGLTFVVDGESVAGASQGLIFVSDDLVLKAGNSYVNATLLGDTVRVVTLNDTQWSLTLDGNTLEFTGAGSDTLQAFSYTWTVNPSECIHLDKEGGWMAASAGTAFNEGHGRMWAFVTNDIGSFLVSGESITESVRGTAYVSPSGTDSITVDVESTESENHNVLVSATIAYNATEYTPALIMPVEYFDYAKGSGTSAMLFSIVPLVLIIACLMVAVRMLGGRE